LPQSHRDAEEHKKRAEKPLNKDIQDYNTGRNPFDFNPEYLVHPCSMLFLSVSVTLWQISD
jgi:hypothetical protein